MVWRSVFPLLIAGVFGTLLFGWGLAYWHDRRQREAERAEEERSADQ